MIKQSASPSRYDPPHNVVMIGADATDVMCNGGGGSLGHPAVYYNLDDQDQVSCLYCDRVFTKKAS